MGVLVTDFRSENGRFTDSRGRTESLKTNKPTKPPVAWVLPCHEACSSLHEGKCGGAGGALCPALWRDRFLGLRGGCRPRHARGAPLEPSPLTPVLFCLGYERAGIETGATGGGGPLQWGVLPSDLSPSACPCTDFTLRKQAVTPAVDAAPRDPCLPRRWRLCPLPASVDDSVGPPEGLALFLSGLCSSWEDVSLLFFLKHD